MPSFTASPSEVTKDFASGYPVQFVMEGVVFRGAIAYVFDPEFQEHNIKVAFRLDGRIEYTFVSVDELVTNA